MRLPASLLQKYILKAAEFSISYVARSPSADGQMQGKCLHVAHVAKLQHQTQFNCISNG
jgi:hypothetical protein